MSRRDRLATGRAARGGLVRGARVEKPLAARPLGGLFGLIPPDDLAFNHASRGAAIGLVGHDRLELRAEGWDFSLEIDGEGRVAPGTRLVFPSWLERGGRPVTLRCRPDDHAQQPRARLLRAFTRGDQRPGGVGYLRISTPAGADEFSGHFLVELDTCENVESGRALEWPPAPLTVRGRFNRLPQHQSSGMRPGLASHREERVRTEPLP